jgi:hypothetical protein
LTSEKVVHASTDGPGLGYRLILEGQKDCR